MKRSALPLLLLGALAVGPVVDVVASGIDGAAPDPSADVAAALDAAPALTAGLLPALGPTSENLELVGHSPLGNRGMNAALALHEGVAYVGSRTDGKLDNATSAGVLVVDVTDPTRPQVVDEIGLPHQGQQGQTSRELRVWPEQDLLVVMNLGSNCSELIHVCSVVKANDQFDFYDVSDPRRPVHVSTFDPTMNPHEFFLWVDPTDRDRALLWVSGTSSNNFYAVDVSGWRDGEFAELALSDVESPGGSLHSMTPTFDGRETHLANLTGGMAVLDTRELARGRVEAPRVRAVTPAERAPTWPGEGAHSAVPLPGQDVSLVTDEVYGDALAALGDHGCPWGWMRLLDTSDPTAPTVLSEFRLPVNEEEFCATDVPRPSSSYSAHNPTVTGDLALVSWHAAGLRVVDVSDPTAPVQTGAFVPEPLDLVVTEDPALTAGQDKVAFWSFPIVRDGLIYVVDIRNGLYVLRYTGPKAREVQRLSFLEGNSNVGDARRLARHG